MKSILLFTDWFVPAYKAGGPIRSCVNFAHAMCDLYSVYIITGNTDYGDTKPLDKIRSNKWISYAPNIKVIYLGLSNQNYETVKKLILEVKPDFLYLNSMFSKVFTIIPLLVCKNLGIKTILSPRGMLKDSALIFKPLKKKIFLAVIKWVGLLDNVWFHATDHQEKEDIITKLSIDERHIVVCGNFPITIVPPINRVKKSGGDLRMVFISRLTRIKNLKYLLQQLVGFRNITLDVFGPADENYLKECQHAVNDLDRSIKVNFHGSVPNKKVVEHIKSSHFFVLPTLGENFGHAIFEAFAAARPVLISDQTPWRGLKEKNIGWDLSLDDASSWERIILEMKEMDDVKYQSMCTSTHTFAVEYVAKSNLKKEYLKLFSK